MLEQNEFNITLKSFDDNKVLKNCQLDMLIFVKVYKTIQKFFEIINRFWKNKKEQRIEQKGSLKASEENCSLRQSALEVMTCHQKLKFIRSKFIRS